MPSNHKDAKRSPALIVISTLTLVAALGILLWYSGGSSSKLDTTRIFTYDLNASELTTGSVGDVPAASAAPGYAWASVFSCGACGEDDQFVGYLHQFDGRLLQRLRASAQTRNMAEAFMAQHQGPPEDHMIKRPDDARWVPYDSPAGQAIRNEVMNRCGGDRPRPCSP